MHLHHHHHHHHHHRRRRRRRRHHHHHHHHLTFIAPYHASDVLMSEKWNVVMTTPSTIQDNDTNLLS